MERLTQILNQNAIEEIVSKCETKTFTVLGVELRCDNANAGDHYLSEIIHFTIRIEVDGDIKRLDFIVKDMGRGLSDFIIEVKGVEKEVSMYQHILPCINQLLTDSVSPQMYYVTDEKQIVVNDLSTLGYKTPNRLQMLDFEQSKVALSTLAKFHASALKYYEISPDKFDLVGEEMLFKGNKDSISYYFIKHNTQYLLKLLETLPDGKIFVKEVESFLNHFWDDAVKAFADDSIIKVLNHGDFWTTNILFRYEDEKIVDCKLIDYQMTRFCPPTYDLYQFITISMSPSLREGRFEELLDVYIETFNEVLLNLGMSKRLTRSNLETLLSKTIVFGLITVLTLAPIALCDPGDPLELSDLTKNDFRQGFPRGNPYLKGYNQTHVQNHIISILKFFRRKNYI